jgi:nucleoid-associated protein YgaU
MTSMSRTFRGLGALALLLLALAGIPAALVWLGGNPLPAAITWDAVRDALLTRDDGTILIGLVTVVGWIAWLVFAASVVSELVTLLSGERIRVSLPGMAGPQRVAAGLLLSVVAMVAAPQLVPHQPAPPTSASRAVPNTEVRQQPSDVESAPAAVPVPAGQTGRAVDGHVHRVQPGDDLWSLAERYYGHGLEWRRIAAANPKVLTGGPDRLEPGWRLVIPGVEKSAADGQRTVTVRSGDTLSGIAERELGSADKWPEIYRVNRAQLSDPDEIAVGLRLVLPDAKRSEAVRKKEKKKATDKPVREEPKAEEPIPTPTPTTEPKSTSEPAPTSEPTPIAEPAPTHQDQTPSPAGEVLPLVAVGSLLAAGLLEGLAWRRRVQLQTRAVGRRIPHPSPAVVPVTAALGKQQRPMSLRTLDRAVRAIAAHSRSSGAPPPPLELAFVDDDRSGAFLAGQPCRCRLSRVGTRDRGVAAALARTGHPRQRRRRPPDPCRPRVAAGTPHRPRIDLRR